ncbi:hypothetical protein [Legionella nagasakiensis]|uniref:hypothetical protein n=1 Tax=Legionella nagasakiensis TaxID=535290 RepID=UPI0010541194|nr:hypothetical protein [Legionella nagasakiensis]
MVDYKISDITDMTKEDFDVALNKALALMNHEIKDFNEVFFAAGGRLKKGFDFKMISDESELVNLPPKTIPLQLISKGKHTPLDKNSLSEVSGGAGQWSGMGDGGVRLGAALTQYYKAGEFDFMLPGFLKSGTAR